MVYKSFQTLLLLSVKTDVQIEAAGEFPLDLKLSFGALLLSIAVPIAACAASPAQRAGLQSAAKTPEHRVADTERPINQRFGNLDEYLAYLEKVNAPIDRPWYRRIRPGVYELQTGHFRPLGGDKQKRVFTREELQRKFGFSR